ncbi:hypothetical protein CIC12_21310 [Burkholderia sp. SG-MS1]|uniref:DUF4148 domain-containing protein n=1 Tax=Paraburkholderia sp. SG-MS1 TaxID=2023741 RepID=UPI0014489703|nr:DUF4148 domain-containing protein [Paraburkholderia sp. SG-MS1]NKJ49225.1 hypothetical protein [Paraburkholderia sp. SG-MS1]
MQTLINAILVIAALVAPALAQAQSNAPQPVTRAEVHASLVQLEKAGYNPYTNESLYPITLQRAEAKIAQQQAGTSTAYGPASNGTFDAGK